MKSRGHRYVGDVRFRPRNNQRFGASFSPSCPPLPPPPTPQSTVDATTVEEARRSRRLVEARCRGRRAPILASGRSDEGATVSLLGLGRLLGGG